MSYKQVPVLEPPKMPRIYIPYGDMQRYINGEVE